MEKRLNAHFSIISEFELGMWTYDSESLHVALMAKLHPSIYVKGYAYPYREHSCSDKEHRYDKFKQ